MDRLPVAMAAELGDRVHLAAPVRAIRQDAHSCRVATGRTARSRCMRARFAVLAIPPPAVRRRQRSIRPPAAARSARRTLAYRGPGHQDADPGPSPLLGGARPERPGLHRWPGPGDLRDDGRPAGERAVLTVYTADRAADALAAMSDERAAGDRVAELERPLPAFRHEVEQAVTVAWSGSSRAGGAYSHFRPGEMARFGPALARPFGRVTWPASTPTPGRRR